jgi:hypothetical protein
MDLIARIESAFDTEEQKLFLASFQSHVHHAPDEFVIDFNEIWQWMGFTRNENAKRLLKALYIGQRLLDKTHYSAT